MKLYNLAIGLLVSGYATASPTLEEATLAERCTLSCAVGYELYLDPASGVCTCVEIKGCTELCTLNLVDYTNPATGVCSCVPKCNTASTNPCGAGYNCVPDSSSCGTSTAACEGACVAIEACPIDCIEGLVHWTNPATGLCACVHPCGVASELPCPTGFVCTEASPTDVCLAESCLSCGD